MSDQDSSAADRGSGSNDLLGRVERLRFLASGQDDQHSVALTEAADEIERLRTELLSCRGTVKTEVNHYERLAMVHGKMPHGVAYEAEAQRLTALLDRIDALGPNAKLSGLGRTEER